MCARNPGLTIKNVQLLNERIFERHFNILYFVTQLRYKMYFIQEVPYMLSMLVLYFTNLLIPFTERERQKKLMEERRQELKELREEKKRVEANHGGKLEREFDPESMEDESVLPQSTIKPEPAKLTDLTGVEHNSLEHEEMPVPKMANIQNQAFHHNEVVSNYIMINSCRFILKLFSYKQTSKKQTSVSSFRD